MNSLVVKAICRRIRDRYGSNEKAALAAGVSPGVFSNYCSDEHPDTSIPFHRLVVLANAEERRQLASVLLAHEGPATGCMMSEACEAVEASARLLRSVRKGLEDGGLSNNEKRDIRERAVALKVEADQVLALIDD